MARQLRRTPVAVSAALLLCLSGCRGLREQRGIRHLLAFRVVRVGGTASAPKNPKLLVRFLDVSNDARSALFEVRYEGESYQGWVTEEQSLGSFARPAVGNSGVVLTKLAPDQATLAFHWAEPF